MAFLETLLLLAGSAAAVAAVGLASYRSVSGRKMAKSSTFETTVTVPQSAAAPNESVVEDPSAPLQIESQIPQQSSSIASAESAPIASSIPLASAPEAPAKEQEVPEAPAPFPEDFAPKASVPTDVGAVGNFSSPAEAAIAPVLVVQAPKVKRTRSTRRKIPTSASTPGSAEASTPGVTAPRRRSRGTKRKSSAGPVPIVSAPETTIVAPPTETAPAPQ